MKEILKRKLEIRTALEGGEKVDLPALEKELKDLEAEEVELRKRQEIANGINTGSIPEAKDVKKPEQKSKVLDPFDTPEYRAAFFEYVRTGVMPAEFRSDAVTTTSDVGAAIPTTTLNKIVDKLLSYGMILPKVTRTDLPSGVSIPINQVKPVATWVAEGKTSDKQKASLGNVLFGAYKLRCAVSVTLEVGVRTISAFEALLVNNIAEAMAIALEQAIVSGSGTGTAKGILQETPNDGQSFDVSAIDFDTINNAEAALPGAYENNSVWLMTKKTFHEFLGIKDTNKHPIAVQDTIGGVKQRSLLGRDVIICDYLPSFASATAGQAFALIFRLSDYALNSAYNLTLKQYVDEDTDDTIRKSIMLADGKVIDKGSLVVLKKVTV